MNLVALYRDHPDLAELLDDRPRLVQCSDCLDHFPPDQLYRGGDRLLCATCFDVRRDAAWQEWLDRLAKEGREIGA